MEEGCLDKREEEDRTHGSWSGHGASRLKILGFPRVRNPQIKSNTHNSIFKVL
jgi:hypothetical protein